MVEDSLVDVEEAVEVALIIPNKARIMVEHQQSIRCTDLVDFMPRETAQTIIAGKLNFIFFLFLFLPVDSGLRRLRIKLRKL